MKNTEYKSNNMFFQRSNKTLFWKEVPINENVVYEFIIINIKDSRDKKYGGSACAYTEWTARSIKVYQDLRLDKGDLFQLSLPTKACNLAWDIYNYFGYNSLGLDTKNKFDAIIHISKPNKKVVKIHHCEILKNNEVDIFD